LDYIWRNGLWSNLTVGIQVLKKFIQIAST
jgi:hypothetical protein